MNSRTQVPRESGRSTAQTIAAAALIVFAAGLVADLVLWPRDQLPPVADVDQYRYFTKAFVARAEEFRGLQSWLAVGGALMFALLPLVLALIWPRTREGVALSRWSDRRSRALLGRGRIPMHAVAASGVALLALTAAFPFELAMFTRAQNAGLAVQSASGWVGDWLLQTALILVAVALLAMLCGWLIGRLPRAWWAVFGGCLIALAMVFQLLAPVVIEPLFAEFKRVPDGQLSKEVKQVAKSSGVDAGEIYTVDAAQRTTGANAYVTGLGATKRVVIYDTLVRDFKPDERRAVVAHEFGHAHYRDLLSGLVWFGFVAMFALFAVDLAARRLAERRDIEFASPAGTAMVLAVAILAIAISQPAANAWSRAIEARADAFALAVTQKPDAAIALERRLTIQNIGRPEPPALLQFVFGTHPTPMQRIGMATTVKRELAAGRAEPIP